MRLKLDWSIKVSDLLTSITIVVSVIALLISWSKDREAKLTEQANRVRGMAAATAIAKLDRWQALQLSMYRELQPTYVEMSELLADRYDVQRVRDQFWKRVNVERTRIAQKVLEEQLGTGYSDLLSHFPAARDKFTDAFVKVSAVESEVAENYLGASERAILSLEGTQKDYMTPILGNTLRQAAATHSVSLQTKSEAIIGPVREYLFKVISLPDSELISASRRTANTYEAPGCQGTKISSERFLLFFRLRIPASWAIGNVF